MAVVKVDPQSRRKLICIYIVIFIVGVIIIQWGLPEFTAFSENRQTHKINYEEKHDKV